MKAEIKKIVICQLLEMLKISFVTEKVLPKNGAELNALSMVQDNIWNTIKTVSNMPDNEEIGVFVSDKFIAAAFDFVVGKLSKDEAIDIIMNWSTDSH